MTAVNHMDKKNLVKRQALFSLLTESENDELVSLLKEKEFQPGETIVTEGDHIDSVYLIVSGTADVRHVYVQNGQQQIESLTTLGPGAAIGLNETGFYSLSGVRTATVVAITNMMTLQLSVPAFHGFALTHKHVNDIMHKSTEEVLGIKPEL